MGLFKNQRRDPATGRMVGQAIAGRSPSACLVCDYKHPPGKCRKAKKAGGQAAAKCEASGNLAKAGSTLCRPCARAQPESATKSQTEKSRPEAGPKSTSKASATKRPGYGWSETSTIRVKSVMKNRWRRIYDGPPVRSDDFLKEGHGEADS